MGATLLDQVNRPITEAELSVAGDRRYLRGPKNYIINGAMMISQENGTTAGTTLNYYAVDQFRMNFVHGGVSTAAQVASATPAGSPNRLRITASTADAAVAAGDELMIDQVIEGLRVADLLFGTASAKTVTIRFGVKAPAGTYCVALINGATNRSYVAEYVISAGEANTDVVKSVTIPGDTSGTWAKDNTAAFSVRWGLMCGTTFQQAAGSWSTGNAVGSSNQFNFMGTINNVFELFDVGLYEGAYAPSFVVPDYASELALCKRYFQQIGGEAVYEIIASAHAATTTAWQAYMFYPVQMRIAPTISHSGSFGVYTPGAGVAAVSTAITGAAITSKSTVLLGSVGSAVLAVGSASALFINSDINARFKLSARM